MSNALPLCKFNEPWEDKYSTDDAMRSYLAGVDGAPYPGESTPVQNVFSIKASDTSLITRDAGETLRSDIRAINWILAPALDIRA